VAAGRSWDHVLSSHDRVIREMHGTCHGFFMMPEA
jgi:hypothetical protein